MNLVLVTAALLAITFAVHFDLEKNESHTIKKIGYRKVEKHPRKRSNTGHDGRNGETNNGSHSKKSCREDSIKIIQKNRDSKVDKKKAMDAEDEDSFLDGAPVNFSEIAFGKDIEKNTKIPISTGQPTSMIRPKPKKIIYKDAEGNDLTPWEYEDRTVRNPGFLKARHMDQDAERVRKGFKDSDSSVEERDSDPDTWAIPNESFSFEERPWERMFSDGEFGMKKYNEWIYASEVLESGDWSLDETTMLGEDDLMFRRVGVLSGLAIIPSISPVQHTSSENNANLAPRSLSTFLIISAVLLTIYTITF